MDAVFMSVSMKIWTGRAALPKDVETMYAGQAIPKEIKSSGSLDIIDPNCLRPFAGLKTKLVRCMNEHTMKFLGGYMLGADKLDEHKTRLAAIGDEFSARVADLESVYVDECDRWLARHPSCAALIRAKQPAPGALADRFAFRYHTYKLDAVDADSESALEEVADTALSQLASEIAEVYDRTFASKEGQYFTRSLTKLVRRCDALSFTTPYVASVGDILKALQRTGNAFVAASVLRAMSDPATLKNMCDAAAEYPDLSSWRECADAIMDAAQPAPAEPAEQAPVPDAPVQPMADLVDAMCLNLDSGGLY